MLFGNPVELLLPSPLHLLLLLIVLTAIAFRASPASRLRCWRFPLLAVTAWCWLAATPAFAYWLGRELEEQYPPLALDEALPPDPVIIVLASGNAFERSTPGLQLNLASYRRTVTAVEVWRHADGRLLFTGAAWPGEPRAVAERMASFAVTLGATPAGVRAETKSLDTYENLRNAAALVEPGRPIILVTSAMHMPRAMDVANRLGLPTIAAPADFRARRDLTWRAWLPNSRSLPLLGLVLHEWLGRAYYALRGWT